MGILVPFKKGSLFNNRKFQWPSYNRIHWVFYCSTPKLYCGKESEEQRHHYHHRLPGQGWATPGPPVTSQREKAAPATWPSQIGPNNPVLFSHTEHIHLEYPWAVSLPLPLPILLQATLENFKSSSIWAAFICIQTKIECVCQGTTWPLKKILFDCIYFYQFGKAIKAGIFT